MIDVTGIELLAIDLDDTLLNDDLEISQRTVRAIGQAIEAGLHITLSTGRMYRSAVPYARELDLNIPLITYQGALVRTAETKETLYQKNVPAELAKEVIKDFRAEGFPINIYLDDILYVEEDTQENRDYAAMAGVEMHVAGMLDDYIDKMQLEPIKVLAIGDEQKLDNLAVILRERYRKKLYITKSKPYFLEVLHPEATKGNGLKAVVEHLGLRRENVAAIGDSFNDLTMLDYSELSVVMGNAKETIKEHADIVIGHNNEDGVAIFIEKYFLKRK